MTLERAIQIAVEAHAGQIDKANEPYILHPLRVMFNVHGQDTRIVAVLHDVVEDCEGWDFGRLEEEGFSPAALEALKAVTKFDEDEDYMSFIQRAGANEIGRRVKIADLEDNMDMSRIAAPTERDHQRIKKYERALAYLQQG